MGGLSSKKLENLELRIQNLEESPDLNGDGIVTRQEMETYMATQIKLKEQEFSQLQEENEKLQQSYDALLSRYETLVDQVNLGKVENNPQGSRVSNSAIEKQIKLWLADPNINIKYIPDRAELFMYKKSLTAFLGGLEKLFESLSLEVLGHRIQMTLVPIEED